MGYRKLTRYMYAHSEVVTVSDVCSPKCTFLALTAVPDNTALQLTQRRENNQIYL